MAQPRNRSAAPQIVVFQPGDPVTAADAEGPQPVGYPDAAVPGLGEGQDAVFSDDRGAAAVDLRLDAIERRAADGPGIAARVHNVGAGDGEELRHAGLVEIILDRLRVIGDTARPEQRLGIRRKKAGKRYTSDAGDGPARWIEQRLRNQPGRNQDFRRRGPGKRAEQLVVFGTNGGARVAVSDLVRGLTSFFVGKFGGVDSMIGHQHALQAIQNQQPRVGTK